MEELRVRKRSGELLKFRPEKVAEAIQKTVDAVGSPVDVAKLTSTVVTRIKRRKTTKIDVEDIQDLIEDVLIKNDLTTVARQFILYRQKHQEEREAKKAIIGKVIKTNLSLNAVRLMHERYLARDKEGNLKETPDDLFDRVAAAVANAEANYSKEENKEAMVRRWKARFKRSMTNLEFLPSSNILMNAGKPEKHLAASIAIPMNDTLRDIFSSLADAVDMQRNGSGTGFNLSNLRERFSKVRSHKNIAGGPLEFLHIFNESLAIIKQNGVRQGANMAILNCEHPDILEFISAKVKDFQLTNFNISVALNKEFMHATILDREYDLKTPKTNNPVKTMYAKQVFDIIVASAWNYADPGVLFLERINQDNPIPTKPFCSTSPCAEFMLSDYECGFIGSINLAKFAENSEIDFEGLRDTIFLAIRFLDNVIDINHFPLKESEKIVKENRKIGLGVMGFAHLLYQLGIPYDSEEGIETGKTIAKFLRSVADEASYELAKERGTFSSWKKSIYYKNTNDRQAMELRNATRLAISPTGSTSLIADTSSSIEPVYALTFITRSSNGKEYHTVDPYLKNALEKEGILTNELIETIANQGLQACDIPEKIKKVFVTTHQIAPEYHVKMQAAFQEFVDNGVSKTVNLPYDATLLDVENVFLLAYKLGCKGVTVYRDGSRQNQVLELTTLIQKKEHSTRSVREELKGQLLNKNLNEF